MSRAITDQPTPTRPVSDRVLLMMTCLCDTFFPEAAKAAVEALEHAGCAVEVPPNQTCCGQPAFNAGDFPASRQVALHTAEVFADERPVIIPSGSCSAMHHHGHGLQFAGDSCPGRINSLRNRTWELFDYLVNGLGLKKWPGRLTGKLVIHDACHCRDSGTGAAMRLLLKSIPGLTLIEPDSSDQCCGFGGTFSVAFPHISKEMGNLKIEKLLEHQPDAVISSDLSCLMHMRGLAGRKGNDLPVLHAAEVLRLALTEENELT